MRVTLARDYEHNGKVLKANVTVDLPNAEARNLIHVGLARQAAAAPARQGEKTKED